MCWISVFSIKRYCSGYSGVMMARIAAVPSTKSVCFDYNEIISNTVLIKQSSLSVLPDWSEISLNDQGSRSDHLSLINNIQRSPTPKNKKTKKNGEELCFWQVWCMVLLSDSSLFIGPTKFRHRAYQTRDFSLEKPLLCRTQSRHC